MFTTKLSHFFKTLHKALLITILLPFLTLFSLPSLSAEANKNHELQLHSDLVLKALQLDFYNVRCRGISVAKNFNKVNRLYITKYSLTANNFIKNYINKDVRAEKENQEIAFKKNLNALGGCSGAREKGWIKEIHDQFGDLYEQAEKSTWFPEEN